MLLSRPALLLAAGALLVGPLAGVPSAAEPATSTGPDDVVGCAEPLFESPVRAATARTSAPQRFARALERNDDNATEVREGSLADGTLWLDPCGLAFFRDRPIDPAAAATARSAADPTLPPGTDVFALSSRPSATRTIHLDFRGGGVRDTGWNTGVGPFEAPPYSIDADPSTFTAAERLQVYKAWLVVAEDYAPFDVDVTTADPGWAGINRAGATDTSYGTRVMVSDASEVSDGCGCGGVAYLDVFDLTGRHHDYYQPAWVFPSGVGADGWNIGEVASHEAGHNLSLDHDGIGSSPYHGGAGNWAPIMGASYGRAMSQWSRGEYEGATTTEDDLALIAAAGAPLVADDHDDRAPGATPLTDGVTLTGTVGAGGDVDAFRLVGGGEATVTVTTDPQAADLDARLRILDATGTILATVDPVASGTERQAHPTPAWTGASWSGSLPVGAGPFTAVVDGVGSGDPRRPGGYSSYGSLGRYTIGLRMERTEPEPVPPLEPEPEPVPEPEPELGFATPGVLPTARRGRSYRSAITVRGPGDLVLRRTAGALPAGLRLSVSSTRAVITGRARSTGTSRLTLAATTPGGQRAVRTFTLRVVR